MANKDYRNYKFLATDVATSGDTTIVPYTSGKQIIVVGCLVVASGIVTINFKSDNGAISGNMDLIANSGFSASNPGGIFASRLGGPLILNLSSNIHVGVTLTYELI